MANSNVSVIGLATWNSWAASPGSVEVGLWNSSAQLLASAFVTTGGPTIGSADWSYTGIAPVALTAGDTYYVGSYGTDANYTFYTSGFSVNSRLTFVQDAYIYNAGFAFPSVTDTIGEGAGGAFFGGNVDSRERRAGTVDLRR